MTKCDIAVIGAGPAGLAAAVSAHKAGAKNIIVIERDSEPGGILNQCIHNGFGLHRFGEELTGPEYASRYIEMLKDEGIELRLGTMALAIEGRTVSAVSPERGFEQIEAGAVILSMGCRERSRGPISVPGGRGSGVFTAGSAQRYLNIEGYLVGKRVVILGSGDIGLIMARRMTLEGAKVLAVAELMPYTNGLSRNVAQCLDDFGIPLYLSHTVTDIIGNGRIEGVVISKVDEHNKPIPGTEMKFDCDTLLLSVGLIPENELSRAAGIEIDPRTNGAVVGDDMQTSQPGIFACGNVLHVHDLVDYVSAESEKAGASAARYVLEGDKGGTLIPIANGENVGYTVPQRYSPERIDKSLEVFFRVRRKIRKAEITVMSGGEKIASFRREFLAPGEMQKINIPKVILDKADENGFTVSAVEVPEVTEGDK
ncbi:MAG: FAD-dependent oxidoreductase [Clostridia bacterium]|nr:FAD-dependent oxidoreductase [Clostridia bacterium]